MSDEQHPKIDPQYPSGGGFGSDKEMAAKAVTTGLSVVIPYVNLVLDPLAKAVLSAPLEKRRTDWFNQVGAALKEIQDRFEGFDPYTLGENEEFLSIVYEATQIAMRTSREEKRKLLLNAVINMARDFSFDAVVHGGFLSMIDRFSLAHIETLRIYQSPTRMGSVLPEGNVSIHGPMKKFIGDFLAPQGISAEALERIHDDLEREKMVAQYGLSGTSQGFKSMLNPIGEAFLKFISNPLE